MTAYPYPGEVTVVDDLWEGVERALDPEQEDLRLSPKFAFLFIYHIVIKSQPL